VTRIARGWRRLWPVLAAANILAAFAYSFRTNDLEAMRRWGYAWLTRGENLYASLSWGCDYPPHAIVLLSPLGLLSLRTAAMVWAATNIVLAVITPWLAARLAGREADKPALVLIATTFWCWSATRTLLQFTLLTVLLGLASAVVGQRRAVRGGILLGLALIKPQIAAPFVLWHAMRRNWRVIAVAAVTAAVLTLVYCIRSGTGPLQVAAGYATVLQRYYTGPASMVGASDLRGLLRAVMNPATADLTASVVAVALLAATTIVGLRVAKGNGTAAGVLALAGVWCLLTFRQLSYGFVLLVPASAYLLSDGHRASWFWLLQAAMIVDVPTVFRRVKAAGYGAGPLDPLFVHFDRLLLAGLFTLLCVLLLAASTPPDREAQVPATR
jgi:hypothetical protein